MISEAATGVLLVNLGTPDAPRTPEVRRYLREFLSDPKVIDLPGPLRALLLYGVILPTRPRKSAEAYAQIWTEEGSPLLQHGKGLAAAVGERLGPDDLVVVLAPDSGRGYLSKVFNDDYLATFGFIECGGSPCVSEVVNAKGEKDRELIYVNPDTLVRDAVELMRSTGVSQVPVAKNEPPFAVAEISGSVSELQLMNAAFEDDSVLDKPVEIIMASPLPTIGIGQTVQTAVELFEQANALLVIDGGRPRTVISHTDVLEFLSPSEDQT